jgi:hypothetical protein
MVSTIVANMRTRSLTTLKFVSRNVLVSSSENEVPLYRDYILFFPAEIATSVVKALVIATPFSFEVICLSRTYMPSLRLGEE